MDKGRDLQRSFGAQLPSTTGGPPGPGRPRNKSEDMTDLIDTLALENGPQMASMALQTLMDGMRQRDFKSRLDSAKAYLSNFHQPSKQIDMNITEQVSITAEMREAADQLTDEEKAIVAAYEERLLSLRPEIIVDAEIVEIEELPPGDLGGSQ